MLSKQVGDFPLWSVVCGLLPAVVVYMLGYGHATVFVVYLAVTGLLAILHQLDAIEAQLKELNSKK